MDKTPFSVYDFLAYIASGSVIVAAYDYTQGSKLLAAKDVAAPTTIFLILVAYIVGQAVSHISSFILEHLLVRRILGSPNKHLLSRRKAKGVAALLFPGYLKALPASVQERVRTRATSGGCLDEEEGLFMHCYAKATALLDKLQSRLDDFRTQYGFARNMATSLVIASVMMSWSILAGSRTTQYRWVVFTLLGSSIMLYRYLKFYRQYSYELLIRFAELTEDQK